MKKHTKMNDVEGLSLKEIAEIDELVQNLREFKDSFIKTGRTVKLFIEKLGNTECSFIFNYVISRTPVKYEDYKVIFYRQALPDKVGNIRAINRSEVSAWTNSGWRNYSSFYGVGCVEKSLELIKHKII